MAVDARALYEAAGITPPGGTKGIHKKKFHECVISCAKDHGGAIKGKGHNCWAICSSSLGYEGSIKKDHRRQEK